ncbi:MAG: hypothetical protein D6732_14595 [Methanobacteriota archaeon]|nr:MAG: hypothetical protein D6732_14595 [Euryarchaeota archaeon]
MERFPSHKWIFYIKRQINYVPPSSSLIRNSSTNATPTRDPPWRCDLDAIDEKETVNFRADTQN